MQQTVTLRGRTQVAALLHRLEQEAGQQDGHVRMEQRNRRTWRHLVLGVLVRRSTRLVALGQVVAPQRRAHSVKAAAQGLGYFLRQAKAPVPALSQAVLAAAVRQMAPGRLVLYAGKALLVLDPTAYGKRSRGRGKVGRQMQHIGRVRAPKGTPPRQGTSKRRAAPPATKERKDAPTTTKRKSKRAAPRVATTYGYVDVWAGVVLRGKQCLPLARQLFSSAHPTVTSQNQVEEAVLGRALDLLAQQGLTAIVLGDRGMGRKELIVRLARQQQDFVLRVDPDLTVFRTPEDPGALLADALAAQPVLGEALWDRGQEGVLPCAVRTLRATVRFSRSGRVADVQEASVTVVQLLPLDGTTDPLVLVTSLPAQTLPQARAIARLYTYRWAVETMFETLHAWGQERFMVRSWQAIDRLLWVLAVAYALLLLVRGQPRLRAFRRQAVRLLKQLSVCSAHLTVGKLAEALSLDYARHARAWTSCWLL